MFKSPNVVEFTPAVNHSRTPHSTRFHPIEAFRHNNISTCPHIISMSSLFSCDEKSQVLAYAASHQLEGGPLEDEELWRKLGEQMNRDWKEVRDAYRSWKMDVEVVAEKPDEELNQITVRAFNDQEEDYEELILNEPGNDEDEIQYVYIEGEAVDVNELEQMIMNNEEIKEEINEQGLMQVGKRQLDLSDFDEKLLKTFEDQSKEELQIKREEHEQKMKLLKMQLDHGKELHKEKMKILKTKLIAVQQQIHHIDHAICNKNHLSKKFKSGPI